MKRERDRWIKLWSCYDHPVFKRRNGTIDEARFAAWTYLLLRANWATYRGLEAGELPWYFPEFEPLSPQCKFNDCTHTHEPDCAVVRAVEEGNILPRRYESYLRILETLKGNPR